MTMTTTTTTMIGAMTMPMSDDDYSDSSDASDDGSEDNDGVAKGAKKAIATQHHGPDGK